MWLGVSMPVGGNVVLGLSLEGKDCVSYLQFCSVLSLFTQDDMVMLVMPMSILE